jgi:glycosyltransferase involved in cell wall biosynthesis
MNLAAVLIARNEGPYLEEWVAHHLRLGVDYIFIYNNESWDNSADVLRKLGRIPEIFVKDWPLIEGVTPQYAAYNDALRMLPQVADYAAFIDADEFLIPTSLQNIKDIIGALERHHPDFGALVVNQRIFGSNGLEKYQDAPVLRRFSKGTDENYPENKWVKSIYRVSCVERIRDPHSSPLKFGSRYNTSGVRLDFNEGDARQAGVVDFSALQLNHYITKSHEEFLWKRARGSGCIPHGNQRFERYKDDGFFQGRIGCSKVEVPATRTLAGSIEEEIAKLRLRLEPNLAESALK